MIFALNAALLDACVLAALHREDTYGYELTLRIKTLTDVSESTLYPVLRRLQKERLLSTYDTAVNGRNRRYYSLTAQGQARLAVYRKEWESFKSAIDQVLSADAGVWGTDAAGKDAAAPAPNENGKREGSK